MSPVEQILRRRYLALVERTLERWPDEVLQAPAETTIEALAQACRNLSARLNGREPLRVRIDPTPLAIAERVRVPRRSGTTH